MITQIKQKLFGGRATSGTVIDEKLLENLKTKKPLERDAQIAVDRNKWFAVAMVIGIIALLLAIQLHVANKRFANNVQVAWVKMYPNGTWDIEFYDKTREQEFFPATIDYLIRQWVKRRYQKIAETVRYDFGYAMKFMSPKMAREFLDAKQFNAAQKAAEISECAQCPETTINVRNIDHYDSDKTDFGRIKGVLYRSNVFVREIEKNSDGSIKAENNKIIPIQWRLKSKKEIEAKKDELEFNPIGLQILRAEVLEDPGSEE